MAFSGIFFAIMLNRMPHKSGPVVEPWPGPYSGASTEFVYVWVEYPNAVLM